MLVCLPSGEFSECIFLFASTHIHEQIIFYLDNITVTGHHLLSGAGLIYQFSCFVQRSCVSPSLRYVLFYRPFYRIPSRTREMEPIRSVEKLTKYANTSHEKMI